MSGIDPQTAGKLVKICGLLASDQAGERAAAALKASRLLLNAGATWQDVIAPQCVTPSQANRQPSGFTSGHAALAAWALCFRADLTTWECGFLTDIRRRRSLTPKQAAILQRIVTELRQGGAV
jgi:hypothetical protein